jgi:hypothetical protein
MLTRPGWGEYFDWNLAATAGEAALQLRSLDRKTLDAAAKA